MSTTNERTFTFTESELREKINEARKKAFTDLRSVYLLDADQLERLMATAEAAQASGNGYANGRDRAEAISAMKRSRILETQMPAIALTAWCLELALIGDEEAQAKYDAERDKTREETTKIVKQYSESNVGNDPVLALLETLTVA